MRRKRYRFGTDEIVTVADVLGADADAKFSRSVVEIWLTN
jgi:hypothetical protein